MRVYGRAPDDYAHGHSLSMKTKRLHICYIPCYDYPIMEKKYDIVSLGSALLDIIVSVPESELQRLGLTKGVMRLIGEDESLRLEEALRRKKIHISAGGSAGNTAAGVAALGGGAAFMGRVGTDEFGEEYEKKTKEGGVEAKLERSSDAHTGRAITFVTPDRERSFATYIGASALLSEGDISSETVRASRILHIEGYLFFNPGTRAAGLKAIEIAQKENVSISLDLSDAALVEKNFDIMRDIVRAAHIVFANEDEARAFTGAEPEEALEKFSETAGTAVVKLGEKGSIAKHRGEKYAFAAHAVQTVNTNGAGDMYAAGMLLSLARGKGAEYGGRLGSLVAARAVAQEGARISKMKSQK